jgi:outer membrane protein assembly factor BamB
MTAPDERSIDDLSRFWNEVVRGGPADAGALDPDLAEVVRRLHQDAETRPSPDFARRLRESLTGDAIPGRLVPHPTVGAGKIGPNGRVPAAALELPTARRRVVSWTWRGLEAAAAVLLITALGAATVLLRPQDQTHDWPTLRGGPARTGVLTGEAPESPPGLLWTFNPPAPVQPTIAVAGGTVYVAGDGRGLYALDAETGAERWRFEPGAAVLGVPAIAAGTLYVGSQDGNLYALDTGTGERRWTFASGASVCCSPAVVDGLVYVGNDGGDFFAIDAKSGERRWTFRVDGVSWSSPAVADGVVFVGTDRHTIFALDAETGAERWRYETEGSGVVPVPAVAEGTVYVASWDGALYALDAATGAQRWMFVAFGTVFTPAIGEGVVYAGSEDGLLYALDAATGAERWQFETGGPIVTLSTAGEESVYVGSQDGYVYAIDAATGIERWRTAAGPVGFGPVTAGGVIYLYGDDGRIYALGGDGGEPLATPAPAGKSCGCGGGHPRLR